MNKKKKLKLLHISHLSKVIFYIFALNLNFIMNCTCAVKSLSISVCVRSLSGGPFLINISVSPLFPQSCLSLCMHTRAPCVLFISMCSVYEEGFLSKPAFRTT